jgi:hypothetical protein
MKRKILLVFFILVLPGFSRLFAQGFQPPAEGKAAVYFIRVSNMSFGVTFEYFQQDKFVGEFKGKGYMRYECDPGEHLFWASAENTDYMTSDIKAGGTYIVIVDVFFGGHLGFHPITEKDKELFAQAKALINGNPPIITTEKVFLKKKEKHTKSIPEKLKLYNEKYKIDPEKNFKHITADMAILPDAMK